MLDELMEKFSAELELDPPLKPKGGIYTVPLDEGLSISLKETDNQSFTMSSTLCSTPQKDQGAFFSQMLLANLFGQGTRGAVLGLDIEGNRLVLKRTIETKIDFKEFQDVMDDFITVIDFWRDEAGTI